MNGKLLPLAVLGMALAACKVQVSVPVGGSVTTVSGDYSCGEGQTCNINVPDQFFDQTFEAVPAPDYVFSRWANGNEGGFLCGNKSTGCRVVTAGFDQDPALSAFLANDQALVALRPIFIPAPCDLEGVNTSSNTYIMRNNGDGADTPGNSFDNPGQALFRLAVRNASCGGGGDAFGSCALPGASTAVKVADCQVLHELVVSDSSVAELDRGVVLDMLYLLAGGQVDMTSGEVAEVESWAESRLEIEAGEVGAIHALETSQVIVNGGVVRDLEAIGSAEITVNGGQVNEITAYDEGAITIQGGDLRILDDNQGNPYAGYLEAQGLGRIAWSGGRTMKGIVGNNNYGNLILTFGAAEITIIGTQFTWSNASGTVVDQPLEYGKLPAVLGWLSGRLANGDKIKNVFWEQRAGSQIVLAAPIQ